jgi:hypothetical protein
MPRPDEHEVTHALERIRRSSAIDGSELTLLTYIVEETLRGAAEELNQDYRGGCLPARSGEV